MKRLLLFFTVLVIAVLALASCTSTSQTTSEETEGSVTPSQTTTAEVTTTVATLTFVENKAPTFQIVVEDSLMKSDSFTDKMVDFCVSFTKKGLEMPTLVTEFAEATPYELWVFSSGRMPTGEVLSPFEYCLAVNDNTIYLFGGGEKAILLGLDAFVETYVAPKNATYTLPKDLCVTGKVDMTTGTVHEISYADMADAVWDAFQEEYWQGSRVKGNYFWDTAEMIEVYIDAYEQTKDPEIMEKMMKFADTFMVTFRQSWLWNAYNDDIMWSCIAFCRISLLTGDMKYYNIAKTNYDATYERAYDDVLGGGLYWRTENLTKNSCVNCPGAIAACLLGELSGDESYYEKARGLIQWELDHMFEEDTGRVYDSYNIQGEINKWASTYNQGTFIGACTYLYKHYGDSAYLNYADAAAKYAMTRLVDNEKGVLDNGENGGNDAPGFKGILVRWLYRYAKETNDLEILSFLQHNADVAFSNCNENGLIWTRWKDQTPEDLSDYIAFSQSTAVSLMFNCQPWW